MDRLIDWARTRGIPEITGQVLADNHPMIGFVRHLGFAVRRVPGESDVVEAVLDLTEEQPTNK
jgi:acetyltransferase